MASSSRKNASGLMLVHPSVPVGALFFVSITLLEAFFDGELISIDNGHLCCPLRNIFI
jgi:hypothetical protein